MKASELMTKKPEELRKQLADLVNQLEEHTADLRLKEVKNVRSMRLVKKDIARLKTVMRLQQLSSGDEL